MWYYDIKQFLLTSNCQSEASALQQVCNNTEAAAYNQFLETSYTVPQLHILLLWSFFYTTACRLPESVIDWTSDISNDKQVLRVTSGNVQHAFHVTWLMHSTDVHTETYQPLPSPCDSYRKWSALGLVRSGLWNYVTYSFLKIPKPTINTSHPTAERAVSGSMI